MSISRRRWKCRIREMLAREFTAQHWRTDGSSNNENSQQILSGTLSKMIIYIPYHKQPTFLSLYCMHGYRREEEKNARMTLELLYLNRERINLKNKNKERTRPWPCLVSWDFPGRLIAVLPKLSAGLKCCQLFPGYCLASHTLVSVSEPYLATAILFVSCRWRTQSIDFCC